MAEPVNPSLLISESYFTILPVPPLGVVDDNVPVHNTTHSIITISSHPFENHKGREVRVAGTFNGIVLLALEDTYMFLYNPFTHAISNILPSPSPHHDHATHVFGFGYGATPDDLKIIRVSTCSHYYSYSSSCDVFSLETGLWSRSSEFIQDIEFWDHVGTFVDGYLYWIGCQLDEMVIVGLNLKEMSVSVIHVPHQLSHIDNVLGRLYGCLCMISRSQSGIFDVWVIKEQKAWSKALSFKVLEGNQMFHPTNILDSGKILMTNGSGGLMIYDVSKSSYEVVNVSASVDVESLASPLAI